VDQDWFLHFADEEEDINTIIAIAEGSDSIHQSAGAYGNER